MGGHGHVSTPPVPDPSIYKVEEVPELQKVQDRLAAKGLKDPWLRNHVWRYHLNRGVKHPNWVLLHFLTYGWKWWVPLLGITIGVEQFLGINYHAGHGHGHDHGDEHDKEAHH